MKFFKTIINVFIWGVLSIYLVLTLLLHIPYVQNFIGLQAASLLGTTLGTEVKVGRVDLGFFNRLIVDNVLVYDQHQQEMLKAGRLSVKIDIVELFHGRIRISSAQLFGAHCKFYQTKANAQSNFQFVLDSLASDETTKEKSLDMRINSLIIRNSSIEWDRLDHAKTPKQLNPSHLHISDISAHILLPVLRKDSFNIHIKKLSLKEHSGMKIDRLTLKLNGGENSCCLADFRLKMPNSDIQIKNIHANYQIIKDSLAENILQYNGSFSPSVIVPSDFAFIHPSLKAFHSPLVLNMEFNGSNQQLNIPVFGVISQTDEVDVYASGRISNWHEMPAWHVQLERMKLSANTVNYILENLKDLTEIPSFVSRSGDLKIKGVFSGNDKVLLASTCNHNVGNDNVDIHLDLAHDRQFKGHISTSSFNLGYLSEQPLLGEIAGAIDFSGSIAQTVHPIIIAKGHINKFDYNNYQYRNIDIDASYSPENIAGNLKIIDPNVKLTIEGLFNQVGDKKEIKLNAKIDDFAPAALKLSRLWGNARFGTRINAAFTASDINNAQGNFNISDFTMKSESLQYRLNELNIESGYESHTHYLMLSSDFASARLTGNFDYKTLRESFINIIGSRLPTLPGLPKIKNTNNNNFELRASVVKTDWLNALLGIPLNIERNISLNAWMHSQQNSIHVLCDLPAFSYNNDQYRRGRIRITTPGDSLFCDISMDKIIDNGTFMNVHVQGTAYDNKLSTLLAWDNHSKKMPMNGQLNTICDFYLNKDEKQMAHIQLLPSSLNFNNTKWNVSPAEIYYTANNLQIKNFKIAHNDQYIIANGTASNRTSDSLIVDLHDVDVDYVLNLVDFDAVSFCGLASGKASISAPFGEMNANANLIVRDFLFENGRMGTLGAHVEWNPKEKQIDINAIANDGPDAMTYINGYVSPDNDYIDLSIRAEGTHLDFMHSFTKSFISRVDGHVEGKLRLFGPLSTINLSGKLLVDGEATVSPLNCTYRMVRDTVILIPDEIMLKRQRLFDKYGHHGFLSGGIHHKHLTRMTYDLKLEAENLLAYDYHDFGDNTFYGTVFGTGSIDISGRSGQLTVDVDVTPEENSVFVYNASNPDAITDQAFITWQRKDDRASSSNQIFFNRPMDIAETENEVKDEDDVRTDIYLNFKINCTPRATLSLLMDSRTNDYITLNGSGTLQATYYNKGAFNMFGTYTVERGTYGITIQNIIKKNFIFNDGGTIVFGGNPYNATLNLQAIHTVNGVSLSGLNIGNSFSSNTIRVNCLMNIQGQSGAPRVNFDIDMPTVNSDEKQMIRSIINSEDEMNQQVLYLLGIGRFYPQGANNETAQNERQQNQTRLAMQSLLSGTLSAQLNSMINSMVNNSNWNFGANISTGDEGWNNAEYEGLISGRLLNNRLLINGQFRYRDNATTDNPSFIGDFDVRYLLYPNGNLALKVYNQTNDRYFTKSSLNTQGIGLIIKKDFNGLSDLFSNKKRKKAHK